MSTWYRKKPKKPVKKKYVDKENEEVKAVVEMDERKLHWEKQHLRWYDVMV